ncbi:MAG: pyridoxal phosphate-dependent aminotransferase [Lachnospiraceae bacterium]|nr:pyridoxal phosphate-dependent aminotransferase [Lachnospiraceae bacterium]
MISNKMKQSIEKSSAIRAMFEEGIRLSKIYGKENVYDFSLGNPSVFPPKSVKNALISLLENEDPNFLHGYTPNAGYSDVREFIAKKFAEEFGINASSDGVVLTNGAAAALNIILKTLLNPDDEVIIFAPFFGEYLSYVNNYDGVPVIIPVDEKSFSPDMSELEKKLSPKTKAVIVNNPNNPSGAVYPEETLKKISEILAAAEKKYGHPIYIISDEPYRKLVYTGKKVAFIGNYYKNTFFAYSFSKTLSLPGERIGYLVLPDAADDFCDITSSLCTANRISGFVNAPTLFQRLLLTCFNEAVDISIYDKNRKAMYNKLIELGFECILPEGAFYMFPKALIPDDKAFCEAAKEFRLLIVPGSAFGCPGYFRLAYCVDYKTIINSFDSFTKLAEKFK